MARFITFRFDDGFIDGARKAIDCLYPNPASFFIISGLVCGSHRIDHEELFKGRNFGSPDEWKAISNLGYDIQSHSITHPNFGMLNSDQQRVEVLGSLAVVRGIHAGPYVFCYPYNVFSNLNLASLGFSAAGFKTVNSERTVLFNDLKDGSFDWFRLRSWAVRERHLQSILAQLNSLPEESWTILAFHSLDGEGHEPWSSESFSLLVSSVLTAGLQVVSIRQMIDYVVPRAKDL